jgi:hypothetical protein
VTPAASTPAARPPPASARRSSLRFAAGLFTAGVLITAALLALTSGGGTATKPLPPPAKLPKLTEAFSDRALGVTGVATRSWVVGGLGPILHLISVDRRAIIAIDAPGSPRIAHGALHAAIGAIRSGFKNVTLKQAPGSTLGGRPAISVVMYGTNRFGVRVRILVASATGRKVTYVMQVSTASNATLRDLEEAQQIISTLRFNL